MNTEKLVQGIKQRLIIAGVLCIIFYPFYKMTGKKVGPAMVLTGLFIFLIPVFLIGFMGIGSAIYNATLTPEQQKEQENKKLLESVFEINWDEHLDDYDEDHMYNPNKYPPAFPDGE
jgi:predicted PurR-regulated permease PerM